MADQFVLINEAEMKRLQTLGYDDMVDWQYNLMQDLIDTSNDIIQREYKDDIILQQGMIMLKRMVLLHMVNRTMVERFPESEMAELLKEQYTQTQKEIRAILTEEIHTLKKHFDEVTEILTQDFENEQRRVDGMDTVNRIATLNLREYEDALNRIFKRPTTV